jgi:integrase/recombinase XerC
MRKTPPDFTESRPALDLIRGGLKQEKNSSFVSNDIPDIESHGDDWISESEFLRRSPRTIEGKRDAIRKLLWWMRFSNIDRCGKRELRKFFTYVATGHERPEGRWGKPHLRNPVSDRTVQAYFVSLKNFFQWLYEEELLADSPMRGIAVPKPASKQVEPFTKEHVDALLEAARVSTLPRRNVAILLFMLDTGLRASEVCGLTMKDVQIHKSHGVVKVCGKGGKERTVAFSRRAARALWNYLRESPREDNTPVFLSDRSVTAARPLTRSGLQQLFERLGNMVGVKEVRCSPHTMRHTFAINFLRAGGEAFVLQAMLGHEDLHMTQRYVKIARSDIEKQQRQFSPADYLGGLTNERSFQRLERFADEA